MSFTGTPIPPSKTSFKHMLKSRAFADLKLLGEKSNRSGFPAGRMREVACPQQFGCDTAAVEKAGLGHVGIGEICIAASLGKLDRSLEGGYLRRKIAHLNH